MLYLANIVTNLSIKVSAFFNVTDDYNSVNNNLPTLIIGWKNVKNLFPNQDILCSKINDNTYWTFSKREKRYQFEKDLQLFIDGIITNLNKNIKYQFFNYLLASESKRSDFVNYTNNGNCSIYFNSRFLYVYNSVNNITIGISLKDLNYIGVNIKKFINSLNINNNNIICENLNCLDTESFSLIKNNVKVVAYLNYLKNHDIYSKNV